MSNRVAASLMVVQVRAGHYMGMQLLSRFLVPAAPHPLPLGAFKGLFQAQQWNLCWMQYYFRRRFPRGILCSPLWPQDGRYQQLVS